MTRDKSEELKRGSKQEVEILVEMLRKDLSELSLLGGKDLELLRDMDPSQLTHIVPDKIFLRNLKEASGRFLQEKLEAKEAMELLKLYNCAERKMK